MYILFWAVSGSCEISWKPFPRRRGPRRPTKLEAQCEGLSPIRGLEVPFAKEVAEKAASAPTRAGGVDPPRHASRRCSAVLFGHGVRTAVDMARHRSMVGFPVAYQAAMEDGTGPCGIQSRTRSCGLAARTQNKLGARCKDTNLPRYVAT
jgi:hypothetical protein